MGRLVVPLLLALVLASLALPLSLREGGLERKNTWDFHLYAKAPGDPWDPDVSIIFKLSHFRCVLPGAIHFVKDDFPNQIRFRCLWQANSTSYEGPAIQNVTKVKYQGLEPGRFYLYTLVVPRNFTSTWQPIPEHFVFPDGKADYFRVHFTFPPLNASLEPVEIVERPIKVVIVDRWGERDQTWSWQVYAGLYMYLYPPPDNRTLMFHASASGYIGDEVREIRITYGNISLMRFEFKHEHCTGTTCVDIPWSNYLESTIFSTVRVNIHLPGGLS